MKTYALDVEVYPNYFLVVFYNPDERVVFELTEGGPGIHNRLADMLLSEARIVTFNGEGYDLPICTLAAKGKSPSELYKASGNIINGMRAWQFYRHYGLNWPKMFMHIDLMNVVPLKGPLKQYAGRLHAEKLQDLPLDPHKPVGLIEQARLRMYCVNDCELTWLLYQHLIPELKLRARLTKVYNVNLMCKSDAQIGENVVAASLGLRKGYKAPSAPIEYRYVPPAHLKFTLPQTCELFDRYRETDFVLNVRGGYVAPDKILPPDNLVKVGETTYKVGVGGIHSIEKQRTIIRGKKEILRDYDVTSFYPRIILNNGLYPEHLGERFLEVYGALVERRLKAKRDKNQVVMDSLRVAINGSFGKLSNRWSMIYDARVGLQITVTGQLALLQLIEMLENMGIPVMSANTDGIVVHCPERYANRLISVTAEWQKLSGYNLEHTDYRSLHHTNINNYFAVKEDGSTKSKGIWTGHSRKTAIWKNPVNEICYEAIRELVTNGVRIEDTINECADPRMFITLRQVRGGALWKGKLVGRIVRWYYSKDGNEMVRADSGNKVPRSDGCRPLMKLTKKLPPDLNTAWYINEAHSIAGKAGVETRR